MNIICLIAGFIFLSNPNIGIIDILPDFIGCCLIIHGIGLAKLYSPNWRDTFKLAVILSVVNGIKTACIPLLFKDIRALPILLSFTFALIECFLLISLINKFFEGLFYVGIRHDISSVFSVKDGPHASGKSNEIGVGIKHFAVVFFIFRSILSVLPDLSDLQIASDKESVFTYSDLRLLFYAAVLIIGSVVAVVFLFKLIPYLLGINKDSNKSSFDEKCAELATDKVIKDKLNMRRIIVLFMIASVTSVFISIDGIIIPAFVPAILLILISALFKKYNNRIILVIPFSLLSAAASVVDIVFRKKYYIDMAHVPDDSLWIPAAAETYDIVSLFTLIERLLIMPALLLTFLFLYKKLNSDTESVTYSVSSDMFAKEQFTSYFMKYRIIVILSIPLFILSALEPILLLELDIVSVLISILYFIWLIFVLFLTTDAFRNQYSHLIEDE